MRTIFGASPNSVISVPVITSRFPAAAKPFSHFCSLSFNARTSGSTRVLPRKAASVLRHDLKLKMLLDQQDQDSPIRGNKFLRVKIPGLGREINSDRIHRRPRRIKSLGMGGDPIEDLLP